LSSTIRRFSSVFETLSTFPSRFSNAAYSGDAGFDFMGIIVMPKLQNITKVDAARRQLATAIELWFNDKDAVSIHSLAYAAYDVIHILSEKHGRKQTLILDSPLVKDEHRKEFREAIRRAGNFFKHAGRDPEEALHFNPESNEFFIYFSILGIELMGININNLERAFTVWLCLQRPEMMTQNGRIMFSERFRVDTLNEIREMPKCEFFKMWL